MAIALTQLMHTTMFRLVPSSQRIVQGARLATGSANAATASRSQQRRLLSSSPLEGDTGKVGTTFYHGTTLGLTVLAPVYFVTPDRYTDGFISKTVGLILSTAIVAHSWIGLNYVCRDYVPKISKSLLGPARVASLGMSVITFLGMAKISLTSPGGLKGLVKGLWTGKPKKDP